MSNPDAFCLWLRGYVELDGAHPTPEQWECIKQHLDLVFTKVTPPLAKPPKEEKMVMLPDPKPGVMVTDPGKPDMLCGRATDELMYC